MQLQLLQLPLDVVLCVADELDELKDINSFARSSRAFYSILNPLLYRINERYGECSALDWATRSMNVQTAQHALNAGTDVDGRDYGQPSPLLTAVRAKYLGFEDPDPRGLIGRKYPVTKEQQAGCDALIRFYIERGANISDIYSCSTVMYDVVSNMDAELLLWLAGKPQGKKVILSQSRRGETPLHTAVGWLCLGQELLENRAQVVRVLLEEGVSVGAKNRRGETALHIAASRSCASDDSSVPVVVQQLLDAGADVNARDEDGKTVLHHILRGSYGMTMSAHVGPIVRLLVRHGADINARDNKGQSVLHMVFTACLFEDSLGMVNLLVENGADVNAVDGDGMPVLQRALCSRYAYFDDGQNKTRAHDIVSRLVKAGADVNARNSVTGETMLHYAATRPTAPIHVLLENGADAQA